MLNHETPRLRRSRCAYRHIQPTQRDHEELLAVIKDLYNYSMYLPFSLIFFELRCFIVNPKNGRAAGMISEGDIRQCRTANAEVFDSAIIYDRDFHYN
jgi:hypothetical protein